MVLSLDTSRHATPEGARALPNDRGHPSALALAHGSMELRWYRPHTEERHLPHDRDEIYFVVAGTATFYCSNESGPWDENKFGLAGMRKVQLAAGHAVFVPAGADHFFEDLSPDFAAWTVFYGPEGGERE